LLRLQGYLDARSTRHVAGWLRDLDHPAHKLGVEVVLPALEDDASSHDEVLATTTADRFSPVLLAVGVGDGVHGFFAEFGRRLTEGERDRVLVRPLGSGAALTHAPELGCEFVPWGVDPTRFQGYVDERSTHHVAGWARNLDDPVDKLELELVLPWPDGDVVLQRLRADRFSRTLVEIGVGDGVHGFQADVHPPLTVEQRDRLQVRVVSSAAALPLAPELRTVWEPIAHLALDIVNNCNLRCPFCVVDYTNTRSTKFMSDATFEAALQLIPYVSDGNFWLSCLHEATLHPKLLDFIARVPAEYRRKLFFTTNLAKRMGDAYFAEICRSGMHHLNISVESLQPAIYEKMRAGARFPIFMENWKKLLAHHATGEAPPPLRYNLMCYRSNLAEIPGLVQLLLDDKRASQVELRHTYDAAHIPPAFRAEEYLTTAEWAQLKQALSHHDPARVMLLMPPDEIGHDHDAPPLDAMANGDDSQFSPHMAPGEAAWNRAPRPFNLSMNWEGMLRVYGTKPDGKGKPDLFLTYAKTNIHFLHDPLAFLATL